MKKLFVFWLLCLFAAFAIGPAMAHHTEWPDGPDKNPSFSLNVEFEMPLLIGISYQVNDNLNHQFLWQTATTSCLCPLHSNESMNSINSIHLNSEDYNVFTAHAGTGSGGVNSVLKCPRGGG